METMTGTTDLTGESGYRGNDVRSDCWIAVAASAEPAINLSSKVEVQYGGSIRDLIVEGLDVLGRGNLRVEIDDQGALPWVIAARLEVAVGVADPDLTGTFLPERIVPVREPVKDRLRRSRLYLPGNTPKFMLNAGMHHPDGVILDLEDSVAPARKGEARILVRNALRCQDFSESEVMVRINQLPLGIDDLESIVPEAPELILIPKVESPDLVVEVEVACRRIADRAGVRPPLLMPIIESARGIMRALEIAEASPLIAALTIGLEDYTADLGVERTREGTESLWARSCLVNAAVAAGIQPIDSVFSDVDDNEGLIASILEAKMLGFIGKGCIHPRQIATIHAAFAPTAAEIDKGKRIVAAFESAQARGEGVVSLGSKMIDAPVVERALHTVRLAETLGLISGDWRTDPDAESETGKDVNDA
ncbi:aldolase/citrate lyase family protein [Gemmatimonadota bacterium]